MPAARVTLDAPLQYRHFGDLQSIEGRTLDARAEVGLLSRNIVIQGDAQSTALRFGGHVMIMGAGNGTTENPARGVARISGVEFRRMGQFDRLGRYPFHWHLNGPSPGDFIRNSVVADSIQRGFVVHGTSGVQVRDNIAYNTVGHSFMVEDGTELGNLLDRNLAVRVQPAAFTLPRSSRRTTAWLPASGCVRPATR